PRPLAGASGHERLSSVNRNPQCRGADLFPQRSRHSSLMLFPLRNTRFVPCLEQHCDSTLEDIRVNVRRTGMADRAVFISTYLSPGGRSAKMPAVFSFQEASALLAK